MTARGIRNTVLLVALLLGGVPCARAAEGVVFGDGDEPLEGARVCYIAGNVELLCVLTDAEGRFELPATATDTLRARAEGYNPTSFSAAGQQGPVVLKRAPVLEVREEFESAPGIRWCPGDEIPVAFDSAVAAKVAEALGRRPEPRFEQQRPILREFDDRVGERVGRPQPQAEVEPVGVGAGRAGGEQAGQQRDEQAVGRAHGQENNDSAEWL